MLRTRVAALMGLGGALALFCLGSLGEMLPAMASESRTMALRATNANWHAFAADLASASGFVVNYEAPASAVEGGGERFSPRAEELGGIGMLRIGALDGPSVLVLPKTFLQTEQVSDAYAQVGLVEPRRFAQALVMDAVSGEAHGGERASVESKGLATLLRETSVLIPVFMLKGSRGEGASLGSPRRNFPVRWEDAAAVSPKAAGPYPASHPSVRALTGWLNSAVDCAGVIIVDPATETAGVGAAESLGKSTRAFGAGTLEAFCDEVLHLSVERTPHDACSAAIVRTLGAAPSLSLSGVEWTRLGSTNWSLEVTVSREGQGKTLGNAVLLAATPVEGEVVLTAVAASIDGESPQLLSLRNRGVILKGMAPGTSRRLRMFFSESLETDELGRARTSPAGSSPAPSVDLELTAPRARRAALRSKSPV